MKKSTAFEQKIWEKKILELWEKDGFAHTKIEKGKNPFVIAMPPPNVTGELHIGHIAPFTFIDIFGRYHRMKGEPTLLIPGTDHASIAAQNVVEKQLLKKDLTRHKLGKEKFLEEMWKYIKKYQPIIEDQIKKVGVSADWQRSHFTLDKDLSLSVKEAFSRLKKDDLIYQADRIIFWCPRCQTALSDIENEYSEEKALLYFIKYSIKDSKNFITVATTRPETMLGDSAVAVNPKDKRYKNLIGKTAILPIVSREIPIIADSSVSQKFGTGAVKVTPAHSAIDFEIGQKHKLKSYTAINNFGKITDEYSEFKGQSTALARENIVKKLKQLNLLSGTKTITHNIGRCYRCNAVIENIISSQWFVKIKPLAHKAIEAVKKGEIKILPKSFEKVYFNWLLNIHDWCISRQLWWGHPLPEKGSEDVLDTWFSSALWPFSTLGWPKKTPDYDYFYPTTLMVTGSDILFFWVARMIMFGIYLTGKPPFKTVFLHGLVLDEHGKKMSKSKNNVIDPLPMIEKYGTDSLRMALIVGNSLGGNIALSEDKIRSYRNFANKIWNATNFVASVVEKDFDPSVIKLTNKDNKSLVKLSGFMNEVSKNIRGYQISLAAEKLYHYFWHEFCDKELETLKQRIYQPKNSKDKKAAQKLLVQNLTILLKLLHPFVPFVTESCWQRTRSELPKTKLEKLLATAAWPEK